MRQVFVASFGRSKGDNKTVRETTSFAFDTHIRSPFEAFDLFDLAG